MATRFYVNWPLQPGPATLEGAEAHHLAAVCRLRPGAAVTLFNGDGREYAAQVTAVSRRAVSLVIDGVTAPERELRFQLEVAAPLPKGDRGQFLIEKLTELGVTSFVPLVCERSVVQPRENTLEKLERYVIEASKQCGRNVLMGIAPPADWGEYAPRREPEETCWLAHPGSTSTQAPSTTSRIRVAVGPEGGFTEREVEVAREHGWQLIDLGPRILRIETAALVMTSLAANARTR